MDNHEFSLAEISTARNSDRKNAGANQAKDVRSYARANVRWPVVIHTISSAYYAETIDIGPTGAFIAFSDPLRLGDTFDLAIKLPGMERALTVTAKVAWSTRYGSDQQRKQCGMGVRFEGLSNTDSERISDAIAGYL